MGVDSFAEIDLAEIFLDASPVRINKISKSFSRLICIVENLKVIRDEECGCFHLSGMERVYQFWADEITDPEDLAQIEEDCVKEGVAFPWFRWFRSSRKYQYAQWWVLMKERKPFSVTLCGELLIVD